MTQMKSAFGQRLDSAPRPLPLAISGGSALRSTPFSPWPCMSEDEAQAAADVVRSGEINYWTGQQCSRFEEEFAASVQRKYAVAVANGTVALELALRTLRIGEGDEVVVPSRTFFATASSVVMAGATPVFADIDPVSQAITADTIRERLSPKTRAVIVVHLAGWPCEMDPILALAREQGLKVIEDCAQAQGALYRSKPVGSFGDAAAFSFCQDKIMSTGGEGGMVVLDDPVLWKRAWSLKDHGKDYDGALARSAAPSFRWLHRNFGTNWRMTEMQAAIGRSLLRKVPGQLEQRHKNAAVLDAGFRGQPALRLTVPPTHMRHAYYKYYVFLRLERLRSGWTRNRLMEAVNAEGIPCYSGSCSECYLEDAVPDSMRPLQRLPVAQQLGETSLMFLVHPTLCEADMADTVSAVNKVLGVAARRV